MARRVERMLGVSLSPYSGRYVDGEAFATTVLGIWIAVLPVHGIDEGAPKRYQLQGRQPPDDRTIYREYLDIDDHVLAVLHRHEPGRWYRPSRREVRIDAGLETGDILTATDE